MDTQVWDTACLNCGTPLAGAFCSHCGQRAAPPHPSFREIAGDALAEFAGWDGKLAETLRALLTKPGQLTADFLDGKRARYISPLRLYLSCSVVYFLLAAAAPDTAKARVSVPLPGANDSARKMVYFGISSDSTITAEERREFVAMIDSAPRMLRPVMRRLVDDPKRLQNDIFAAMPKALFALLPVFAAILALFYRKRHFVEHLYFAFHLHAFAFVAMCLSLVAKFAHSTIVSVVLGSVVLVWIPIYAHLAFRRTYGGSSGATLLKETGIGALYSAASIPALVALTIWVSWR